MFYKYARSLFLFLSLFLFCITDGYYFQGFVCLLAPILTCYLPKYSTFEHVSEVSEYSSEYLRLSSIVRPGEGSCSVSLPLKARGEMRRTRVSKATFRVAASSNLVQTLGAELYVRLGTAINIPIRSRSPSSLDRARLRCLFIVSSEYSLPREISRLDDCCTTMSWFCRFLGSRIRN